MAVVLDFEGSFNNLLAGLKSAKADLTGVSDGYEKLGDTERKVLSGAAANQDRFAGATEKASGEVRKQQKSIEALENQLKGLETGQKKATDPETVKRYNTEIAKTQAAIKLTKGESVGFFAALSTGASVSKAAFSALRGVLASTFAPLFAVGAVLAGLRQVVTLANEFEQGAADLSAITGATGDALVFLKEEAIAVGTETTVSAIQTLEAYKLIASAKPELLANADALAEFTRQTITLTEAMGGELPQVATDLTDIMNQFSAPASEAGRFVNTLAAGSKESAAEVANLAAALVVSGAAAKTANITLEESVATLEALAEQGKKGSEAGTSFNNIALRLSATDVLPVEAIKRLEAAGVNMAALSDTTLSFSDRLKALKPVQNDANALVAVFGDSNFAAAKILIDSAERIDVLTEAVTGTNTAQEQAAIRTATASAEWQRLKNTIAALVVGGTGGLSTFLAVIIRFVREGILFVKSGFDALKPTFDVIYNAFAELFTVIAKLIPAQQEAGEGASVLTTIFKFLAIPFKVLGSLLGFVITQLAGTIEFFGKAVKSSGFLQKALSFLTSPIRLLFSVLSELPAYVDGGLAAISVFVSETGKAIGGLGQKVGAFFYEMFNIKKLITEGAGDLKKAANELFIDPFKGIGEKSAKAFRDSFNKVSGIKQKNPVTNVVSETLQTTGITNQSFSRSDEVAAAQAKKAEAAAAKKAAAEAAAAKKAADAEKKAADDAIKLAEELEKAKLNALAEGREKQLIIEDFRYRDLLAELNKFGLDTSQATIQHETNKFEIRRKFIEETANLEQLSGEERIRFIYEQNKAEIEALENSLKIAAPNGELSGDQTKQINFLKKQANDQFLKDLSAFQDDEIQKAESHEIALLELQRAAFDSQIAFEDFKEKAILDIRLKYAEQALALLEKTKGAESDAALALRKTINEIKGDIAELGDTAKEFSIYKLIGLDPNNPEDQKTINGINVAAQSAINIISEVNARRLEAAETAIKASDEEIENIDKNIKKKEEELKDEKDLGQQGFANRQIEVQQEIDVLKQQQEAEKVERDKAVKEKQRAQKAQAILDTITQGSSLITAAAQIFQSVAAIPFVGVGIAVGLIGAMLGGFIAAKAKVFQNINKQKARHGMSGKVTGRLHSQGGENFGDHIEVERGEAFGILSREATAAHGDAFTAFVNAANNNDLKGLYKAVRPENRLNSEIANNLAAKEAKIISLQTTTGDGREIAELRKSNELLTEIVKLQSKPKTDYIADGSKIITTGKTVKVIRKTA